MELDGFSMNGTSSYTTVAVTIPHLLVKGSTLNWYETFWSKAGWSEHSVSHGDHPC